MSREVYGTIESDRVFHYKYRARIESRLKVKGIFRREEFTQYRYVIERHFIGWRDLTDSGWWYYDRADAEAAANRWLDDRSREHTGYVS